MKLIPLPGCEDKSLPYRLDHNHLGTLPGWGVDLDDPYTLGHLWNLCWAYIQGTFHLDMMGSENFRNDPLSVWVHAYESQGIQCGVHKDGTSLAELLAEVLVWIWIEGPDALDDAKRRALEKGEDPTHPVKKGKGKRLEVQHREVQHREVQPVQPVEQPSPVEQHSPVEPVCVLVPTPVPVHILPQAPVAPVVPTNLSVPVGTKKYPRLMIKPRVPVQDPNPKSIAELFNLGEDPNG